MDSTAGLSDNSLLRAVDATSVVDTACNRMLAIHLQTDAFGPLQQESNLGELNSTHVFSKIEAGNGVANKRHTYNSIEDDDVSDLGFWIWGGIVGGLLFTILIALVNVLKYLREIRDLLKDRKGD